MNQDERHERHGRGSGSGAVLRHDPEVDAQHAGCEKDPFEERAHAEAPGDEGLAWIPRRADPAQFNLDLRECNTNAIRSIRAARPPPPGHDPGIHEGRKLVQAFLTFAVVFPSLLTFFNVVASLESGARARGWVTWFGKLPWGHPSLAAQLLAMLMCCAGGIGGLINAFYNVNLVLHNTTYVVGHFHTTVGTAVTLTLEADRAAAAAWHRKAQWRLDFVAAENSMGFHAPQELARILGETIDLARQGQLEAERATRKK